MSHIVIDARESGTSTGRYIDKLVEYLHKTGTKHRVSLLAKTPRHEYLRSVAPKFEIVECNIKEFTFAEQFALKKQLESLKPDLVHFPMVQQPVWYQGKVVTTMNDLTTVRFRNPAKNPLVFNFKRLVYVWVNKRVARKSAHLLTFTDFVAQDVAKFTGVPLEKFTTTYLAAEPITDPAEAIPALQGKEFIMYLGRPGPNKNLSRLIDAFAKLQTAHPDLLLVLAGKKDVLMQQYEKQVQSRGLKGVVFTDFVSEGQLRWLYANTAAYVFPSLSEGFGLPGLEAILGGAAVAVSQASCLPEVYKDGAIYFDPLNVDDIATKVGKLIDDPKQRAEVHAKGLVVAQSYNWADTAQQTLAVYDRVLG